MSYFKKLLITCLLIFGATISKSQSIDSIEFNNAVEAECFQNIKDKKELNTFNLLMVTNSKNVDNAFLKSSYQKIQSFVNGYNLNDPKLKSIASLKDIYKRVHSTFLINYDIDVDFKDIFETGKYNCVTASSLFALILDKLSIEYLI